MGILLMIDLHALTRETYIIQIIYVHVTTTITAICYREVVKVPIQYASYTIIC